MEGFLNVLASSYIILIALSIILILAIIGYNSIKNDDLVVKNDVRSNKNKPELEDLKKEVEGKAIGDSVNQNTMRMDIPTMNEGAGNEVEKL